MKPEKIELARRELAKGTGINKTAKIGRAGVGTVHKLRKELAATP